MDRTHSTNRQAVRQTGRQAHELADGRTEGKTDKETDPVKRFFLDYGAQSYLIKNG